jgi:hypothetical protein
MLVKDEPGHADVKEEPGHTGVTEEPEQAIVNEEPEQSDDDDTAVKHEAGHAAVGPAVLGGATTAAVYTGPYPNLLRPEPHECQVCATSMPHCSSCPLHECMDACRKPAMRLLACMASQGTQRTRRSLPTATRPT